MKNTNNIKVITNTTVNEKPVSEILGESLKAKKLTNDQSAAIYSLKLTVEDKIERKKDGRNWSIEEIPLSMPEVNLAYQREPKWWEVKKIIENFDINKVEVKAASIRKVDGKWHVYLMDGAHTLAVLLYMQKIGFPIYAITVKLFVGLTLKDEAYLFATQNEGKTNLRGYERYKAELCAEMPEAVAIDKVTKEFGLTVKTNHNSTINRAKNINAIEELYRIAKRFGEEGLRFVFYVLRLVGWTDDLVYTQRILSGISSCYPLCKDNANKSNYLITCLKQFETCDAFVSRAQETIKEHEGHPADKIRDFAKSFIL